MVVVLAGWLLSFEYNCFAVLSTEYVTHIASE